MRRAVPAVALLAILAACQATAGSPSASGAPPSPPASAAPVAPTPGASADLDQDWITRPALTCGDERRFPPEAIAGIGLAELGLDPAAAVLRATIMDVPDYFPDSGWHRVAEVPGEATFVARGNADAPWLHIVVGDFDGALGPIVMGQCHLQPVAPEGVTLAHWWLDPAAPLPTKESTKIAILLREQACANGKPPVGRVLRPTIILDDDAILVAVAVTLTPGGADCPGNPPLAMELTLPEPLGGRPLLDAGVFPPRAVTTEDPG